MILTSVPIWVFLWMYKKHGHNRRVEASAEKDSDALTAVQYSSTAVPSEDPREESEQIKDRGKEAELEDSSVDTTVSVYSEKGAGRVFDGEGRRRLHIPSVIEEAPREGDELGGAAEETNSPRPSLSGSESCPVETAAAEAPLEPLVPFLELRMIITTLSVIFYFYLTVTTALVSVFLCRRLDVVDPPPIYHEFSIARGW